MNEPTKTDGVQYKRNTHTLIERERFVHVEYFIWMTHSSVQTVYLQHADCIREPTSKIINNGE